MPIRSLAAGLPVLVFLVWGGRLFAQNQSVWQPTTSVPVRQSATIHYGSAQTRTTPAIPATNPSRSAWGNPPSAWSLQPNQNRATSNQPQPGLQDAPQQQYAGQRYPGQRYPAQQYAAQQQQYRGPVQSGPDQLQPGQFQQPPVPAGPQWPQAFAVPPQQQYGQYPDAPRNSASTASYGQGVAGTTPQQFGFQNQTGIAVGMQNQNQFPGQQLSPSDAARLQHIANGQTGQHDRQQADQPKQPDPREQAFWNSLYGYNRSTFNQSQSNYSFADQNRFNQSPVGLTRSGVEHSGFTDWSGTTHNVSNFNQNRSNYSLHNVANPDVGFWR